MKLRKLRAQKYCIEYIQEVNLAVMVILFITMLANSTVVNIEELGLIVLIVTILSSLIEVISQFILMNLENKIKRRIIIDRAKKI